jgi:DNA-binding NarL/FixJ family response regulator
VVLLERLRAQHARVREALESAESLMSSLAHSEIELVGIESIDDSEVQLGASPRGLQEIDDLLTEREREVLLMIVRGLTNQAIAERLIIKEGTVKSHVKQILRKVGAVNRTEAISRYLGRIPD